MSIAGLQGRAFTDPTAPEAPGICDRCGCKYLLKELSWQFEYRGNSLVNIRLLVCPPCLDVPFIFNKPLILPPDPVPVENPRPGWYALQEGPPPPPDGDQQLIDELG